MKSKPLVWLMALLWCVVLVWPGTPQAQTAASSGFDHTKTGFTLTGQHANERCESCHLNGLFKGTPRDCASCHSQGARWSRGNAVKPGNHIPTQQVCENCHNTQTFSGARFSHADVRPGSCSSCHNGQMATGKPSGHINSAAACDSCHKTRAWLPAAGFDHKEVAPGTCATCHNGVRATGKHAQHMPVAASSCDGCHKGFTAWRPAAWNHTQVPVTAQCSSCHSGAYPPADARPANHVPYQALSGAAINNCDSCHKAGFAGWTPARLHSSVSVSNQCASCHTGSYPPAVGKPNTPVHVGVTTCESCHKSTASWLTVSFAHSPANAVGTGTCDNCHNGTAAKGKPGTHIPVTTGPTKCDSCHKSQASFATNTTMNHSVVAASTCKGCHNGSYVSQGTQGALAKPANHIPENTQLLNGANLDCNACHKSTTAWSSMTMNHNGTMGNGAGWCKGCHLSGTNFLGGMEKKSLTHEKKTPVPTDCSMSGCHRPLGNTGAAYSKWD